VTGAGGPQPGAATGGVPLGGDSGSRWSPRLSALALALFFAWAAVSFVTPIDNSDVWTNIKLGRDILAGAGFPESDQYSATAAGRPFVAYEWLSAVVFALVHGPAGSAGLVALRVAACLVCLALMGFALEPRVRASAALLPLLVLAAYLLCFRSQVRPHLFSLVIVSALCFSLERWRRTRRLREIAWLVPAHAVWANLHGAFLFGIALLAAVGGLVGLLVLFRRGRGGDGEDYTSRHCSQLLGVAAGSLLASLVNPYGTGVLALALRISEQSDYIRTSIFEWRSPLVTGPWKIWFQVYCAILALLWSSVLLRLRQPRWIDLLIALIVTAQSLRANRFVPYAAIFAVPIVARSAHDLARGRWGERERRLRPALSALLIAFMLATAFGPLSTASPRAFRKLGWGVSPTLPFEELGVIARWRLEGVIFNEYEDGGPIIYALHPRVRPVMDARIDVYGPELSREWTRSRNSAKRFFAYLDKYDVNLVLLARWWKVNRDVSEVLLSSPEWRLVYTSDERVLFARTAASGRLRGP